jgi:TP901 family phage tail tape measure protein
MATKPIQSTDIASKDVFAPLIADTKELIALYEVLDQNTSKAAKNVQQLARGLKANTAGDLQKAVAAEKEMTAAIIEQEKRERAKIQTKKTLIGLEKMQAAAVAKEIKEQEQLTNVYKRESKQLNDLRNSYKNLAAQNKANTKEAKAMLVQITKLDTKLKGIDKTVGQSQRNVGNYKSALGKLGGAVGSIGGRFIALTSIIYGLGRVITSSVGIFADFEQENANLAAVLGKSRSEITKLTDDAKRLGASTKFTASEVTRMQVAFSKLGFNEDEIIAATEATLALAAATGTELEEAAEVSASTLNGFGLEASETQRVVDVMAKSFSTSALDMEKFKVAMRAVGPVAKTAGFSIERTTAMIGVLADNGVRAETAGTGLRNVFLELSKRGITFEQAMSKIANSSDKAATSMELFGKENAVVGVVLSENNEKLVDMEKGLQNAGGAAQEMADTQLDTLRGAMTKLSSAWEGFILSIEDGNGVLSKVLKGAIDLTTELVSTMTLLNSSNVLQAYQDQLNVGTASEFEKIAISGIKNIKEQLQLSTDVLKSKEKESELAARILKLRSQNISEEEAFLILSTENFVKTQAQLDKANKAKKDDQEQQIAIQKEINKLTGFSSGGRYTVEVNKILEFDISAAEGLAKARKQNLELSVKQKSNEEIISLLANEQLFKTSEYGSVLKSILKTELQRREDIKGSAIDLGEIDEDNNNRNKEALTGLAKLQKELADLEKQRSDYLVKTGGVMDTQFYKYTEQVIALEESIDSLQSKLKERGITFQQARKIEGVDENGNILLPKPKDTLATDKKEDKDKYVEEEKKRIEDLKHLSQSFTDITLWLTEQRIQALERENEVQQRIYDESKTREQEIIELRKAGALNTAESLAFERETQANALKEQEKIAKKKQRLELLNTSLNMFNSAVQNGNGDPLGKTIGDVTALVGFIKSIPLFWKGTDATVGDTLGTKFSNGRDGILARVDASEMILNKGKVDALKGMGITTTDGILEAIEMRRYTATPTSVNPIMFDNSELVNRLEKHERLLQKIANRPYEVSDIEKIANTIKITQQIMTNNKTVTTTKNIRTR